jgi:acylphosphatase
MPGATAKLVHYAGHVQGVGFRYTTCRIATRFDVVGYVKNLPDGRVEVLTQGDDQVVDEFLQAINRQMGHYVRNTTTSKVTPSDHYSSFDVAF